MTEYRTVKAWQNKAYSRGLSFFLGYTVHCSSNSDGQWASGLKSTTVFVQEYLLHHVQEIWDGYSHGIVVPVHQCGTKQKVQILSKFWQLILAIVPERCGAVTFSRFRTYFVCTLRLKKRKIGTRAKWWCGHSKQCYCVVLINGPREGVC